MKKIYIIPTSTIYKVNGEAIMLDDGIGTGSGDNPGSAESKGTGGSTGAKIDWEIDDEDDE